MTTQVTAGKAKSIADKIESNANPENVPQKPAEPPKTIGQFLSAQKRQLESVLPKHLTPERLSRIALSECRRMPLLLECDPRTLFGAVISCAQLGLEPGSERGLAYILPYRNNKTKTVDVNLIIGYKGFVEMGWRSGMIKSIDANPVYENDLFEYQLGTDSFIRHVPALRDRGELIAAYCAINTTNGGSFFKIIGPDEAAKARAKSQGGNSDYSPWKTSEPEMWTKTAIRRCYKLAPMSPEIQKAVTMDEYAEAGIDQHLGDVFENEPDSDEA